MEASGSAAAGSGGLVGWVGEAMAVIFAHRADVTAGAPGARRER
jgi:hypothetical protein